MHALLSQGIFISVKIYWDILNAHPRYPEVLGKMVVRIIILFLVVISTGELQPPVATLRVGPHISRFSKETYRLNYQSPDEIQLIAEIAVFFSVLPYLFLTSLTYQGNCTEFNPLSMD